VRLILSVPGGRPVEQPALVRDRYRRPPAALPVTITAPAEGVVTPGDTVTVTDSTAPGARVAVSSTPTDVAAETATASTTASSTGAFSVVVRLGFGTNVITIGASLRGDTGYARRTVVSESLPGTVVLDLADPAGDDHGPGSYAYPSSDNFHDGAFDLQRFQVIDGGPTVYLRAQLRDLTPTFGSPIGPQLLDVFIRDPAATAFATAGPHPARNYAIAADSAWSSRIEVEGFAASAFVDTTGTAKGTATVTANQATRSILIAVPKSGLGLPAAGWVFTVVLHGQDGFSPDRARGFAATPQPFQFGVCATGGTGPICTHDPGAVPKAIDTIPPSGVDQATELNPTLGPVAVHGVPIR
jgi:glucoamylase